MKKLITFILSLSVVLSCEVGALAAPGGRGRDKNNDKQTYDYVNDDAYAVSLSSAAEDELTSDETLVELPEINFYIQVNGVKMDKNGSVTPQSKSNFTGIIARSYLTEQKLDSFNIAIGDHVTEDDIRALIYPVPDDGDVLFAVIEDFYDNGYIRDTNGDVIPWSELTTENYRPEWYVIKHEVDGWHADGCIIKLSNGEPLSVVVPEDPEDIPEEAYKDLPIETPTPEPTEEPTPTPEPVDVKPPVADYDDPIALTNDYAYIFGRNDKNMEAEDGIKRGEIAAVLYRLLKQNDALDGFKYDIAATPVYADTDGRWDRSALEYMHHIGVYDDADSINPDAYVPRREAFRLMVIALEFTKDTTLPVDEYAAILKDAGYIEGDDNGDLMLDSNITRAEMCKIYNEIIGRDKCVLETAEGETITAETYGFEDLSDREWYYEDVLKATSAFTDGYADLEKRGIRNVLDDYS